MEKLFKKLAHEGGCIVSSADCGQLEIAEARVRGDMFVTEGGLGYIRRLPGWLKKHSRYARGAEFLDDASKAKSELMDKEIGTFLSLEGVTVSLLEEPEVGKRGTLERHPDGTEYFIWDDKKVLKFNPPSTDESILIFDCDRLYLKR